VWDYAAASARHIFGNRIGVPLADALWAEIQRVAEISRTDLWAATSRNAHGADFDHALEVLRLRGLAESFIKPTGGRPAEYWRKRVHEENETTKEAGKGEGVFRRSFVSFVEACTHATSNLWGKDAKNAPRDSERVHEQNERTSKVDGDVTGDGGPGGSRVPREPPRPVGPVMMTRRMEADLRGLGYPQGAIDRLTPAEALDIIARGAPYTEAPAPAPSPGTESRPEPTGPPSPAPPAPDPCRSQSPEDESAAGPAIDGAVLGVPDIDSEPQHATFAPHPAPEDPEARAVGALDVALAARGPLTKGEAVNVLEGRDRPPGERLDSARAYGLFFARIGKGWRYDGARVWPLENP
jgi:hypothetical protein